MKYYCCIDIGGTEIKYGVLDENGQFLTTDSTPTQARQGGGAVLAQAVAIARDAASRQDLSGVCIATAGMVDIHTGEILHAGPQIPDYAGTKIKAALKEATGLPCQVDNDVKCAGLAEATLGAGKGFSPCLCLTIGTGIGGCLVVDGAVYRGASGSACEVGYMLMGDSTFQELASASALTSRVSAAKGQPLNGKEVFRLAKEGDPVCVREIDALADHLTTGMANLVYALNPQVIVLGGGIMKEEAYLRPRLQAALDSKLVPFLRRNTRLAFAATGNNAGMLGAWLHFLSIAR